MLEKLTKKYKIPKTNIIGHADIAPGRKVDPSAFFPWKELAEKGFGIWYDEEKLKTVTLPESFNEVFALKYIGYNTAVLSDAIRAFKLHFNPTDITPTLMDKDKKILYLLMDEL
ncbi:hypothetical protein [Tenacibaculum sp. UWU-22]|uniref:hypothetical protein n=1 Tax=Tenacibaculum sp. UWU-22 TaxID=3234187 RepID=UPI0034DAFD86